MISSDFTEEMMEARRKWNNFFKGPNREWRQGEEIFFKDEGRINMFSLEKQRKLMTSRTFIQEILKIFHFFSQNRIIPGR